MRDPQGQGETGGCYLLDSKVAEAAPSQGML